MPIAPEPYVGILMAVYNGDAHLKEQLESFCAQTHPAWHLLASDDGSTDISTRLLQEFASKQSATVLSGPGQGSCANFMSLIRKASDHLPPGCWLSFSDQDDVWLPDRLKRGIHKLQALDGSSPALYCSRTLVVDTNLNEQHLSAARPRPPGFRNALVQNIASGNTILLNPKAAALVMSAAGDTETLPVVHDWWIYQIVTGAGGVVVHDDDPTLLYRQHQGNAIGDNQGLRARLRRLAIMVNGGYRSWNDTNIEVLRASAHRLTLENRALFQRFEQMRSLGMWSRLRNLRSLGLYRQGLAGTLSLWIAAMLGRL